MAQVQAHLAEHGCTYFAWHQNDGRGQRGNTWKAAPGLNLTMSMVVIPSMLGLQQQFYLSAAVALACADFFTTHALYDTCIKWPNDIYWRDRKAGGILIENVLQGSDWKYSIVGVGLNINETDFDAAIKNPVSLKQVTGKSFDLLTCAYELCACMEERWQQLVSQSFTTIMQEYNERLYKRNEVVGFKKESATLQARVLGVNEQGELLLNTGSPTAVPFGGVEWIIP